MIVLDASLWVDVLTADVQVPELRDSQVGVPPHFDAEVVGTLRALAQRTALSEHAAEVAVRRHLSAPFLRIYDARDVQASWQWRASMSLTDGWYAAIALRMQAPWFTADRRAARAAKRWGVDVRVS